MIKHVSPQLAETVKQYLNEQSSCQQPPIYFFGVTITGGEYDGLILDGSVMVKNKTIEITHIFEMEKVSNDIDGIHIKAKSYCMESGVKGEQGRIFKELYYNKLMSMTLRDEEPAIKETMSSTDKYAKELISMGMNVRTEKTPQRI